MIELPASRTVRLSSALAIVVGMAIRVTETDGVAATVVPNVAEARTVRDPGDAPGTAATTAVGWSDGPTNPQPVPFSAHVYEGTIGVAEPFAVHADAANEAGAPTEVVRIGPAGSTVTSASSQTNARENVGRLAREEKR